MFGKAIVRGMLAVALVLAVDGAMADTFGTLENQFTIDFVGISGSTNPTDTSPSDGYGIVNNDYRMGTYEITNAQWNKFTAAYGTVTGSPLSSYDGSFHNWGTGTTNVPTNMVSWYEVAQFTNWLNTSTGHQAAYKFTGTQGTSDYTFAAWSSTDSGYDAGNPYRNTAAKYYLPTGDEWVKAAYWNGTTLQTYATQAGESLAQGDGVSGTGWNYIDDGYATNPYGPWNVGSGSQELNGTYDMMGNVWEWMESPWTSGDYGASSSRGLRGGHWHNYSSLLAVSSCGIGGPTGENYILGFRVASVPEPGSIAMLVSGAVAGLIWWKRRNAMFEKSLFRLGAALVAVVLLATTGQAVNIETVPVGNPGNANDTHNNGYGGVDYAYRIGKYEVTNAQWREFLTAKAGVSDPYGLYNTSMAETYGGIDRAWLGDHYVYSAKGGDTNWDNRPVNYVSFWDTARFCNWLHNGQGSGDTETGAYINIGSQTTFARQVGAQYFIPTENEWYKAAYHKNDGVTGNYWDYPTGTDSVPNNGNPGGDTGNSASFNDGDFTIGSPYWTTPVGYFGQSESLYGTFDQGGNVWEWNESILYSSLRGLRGGYYDGISDYLAASYRNGNSPSYEVDGTGFRVASVPEPGSMMMFVAGAISLLAYTWRRRKQTA
jgi:formylglycine-generating enzyme required for sulfatase activity